MDSHLTLKLWHTLVRSVLNYNIEVWGLTRWPEAERLQLEMGRLILGVSSKTAGDVIRGELGLWMLSGSAHLAVLSWWGKLTKMSPERLPYQIYHYRRQQLQLEGR